MTERRQPPRPGLPAPKRTLAEEVNDTPPGGFRRGDEGDVDRLLARYNGDESIPPPPPELERRRGVLATRMRNASESGSWQADFEAFAAEMQRHYEWSAERALLVDRLRREKDRADRAEKALEKRSEWWADFAKHALSPVVAAGILALCGVVAAAAYFFSHK